MATDNLILYSAVALSIYTAIMIYFGYKGFAATREDETMRTYTLARGYVGPIALGIAYAATFNSAVVFIGFPGWLYVSGLSGLWGAFAIWGTGVLGMILLAKHFRRIGDTFGSLSLPEWIGHRYGEDYLKIWFGILVFSNILFVGSQLTGLALIFESLLNVPFTIGVFTALVLVIAYTFLGGTYTDVMTDFVQGILMMIVGISIFASMFWLFGGPFQLADQLQQQSPNLVSLTNPQFPIFGSGLAIVGLLVFGLILGIQPQLTNKFLTLDKERDIKLFIFSAMFSFLFFYMMLWAGPIARALEPSLATPDKAVFVTILNAFPPIVAAIFGTALLSATLSTSDGLIVSIGTAVGNDIYRSVLADDSMDQKEVEKRSIRLTRITVIAVGLVAAIVIRTRPEFLATLATVGVFGFASGATAPLVLGIYWDGGSAPGALVSGVVGPLLFLGWLQGWWLSSVASIFVAGDIATIVAGLAMIGVSLATKSAETGTPQPAD